MSPAAAESQVFGPAAEAPVSRERPDARAGPPAQASGPRPTAAPASTVLLLAAVVILALLLRAPGAAWQLPWAFHPDEGHYVWKAVDMVRDGNLNPKYFRNPSLYTYLLAGQFEVLDSLGLTSGVLALVSELFRPPSLYLLVGRLTSAVLGAATVWLVYRLGRQLGDGAAGLLGGLLLAVAFIHVRDSHFATNDVTATFLLTASVVFSARLARSGRARDALLAGLLGGLATSAKYNAGFFVLPLLVAHLVAHRGRSLAARPLGALAGAGLVSLAGYLVGTPFTLLAWPTFRDDFLVQQRFSRDGWEGQGPAPVPLLYLDALGSGLGWVTLGLAGLGFALLARRSWPAALLLGAYPLGYLLFMFGVKLFFVRFAVTLAPFLCLAAGYAVAELARLGRTPSRRAGILTFLTLAALAQPLWSDLQHRRIMLQADTRAQAYAWLEANVPAGARIIAEEYSVRDRRPRADLPDRARYDLDLVNALSEHDLAYYRRQGYQYAVTSSFQYQRFPGPADTYASLEAEARRLATFAPSGDGRELPFDIEALYSPFHDLAVLERPGPTIAIYALEAR